MLKEITEKTPIFSTSAVAGVVSIVSSVTQIKYKDSVGYQFYWDGNPSGTFHIQVSNDYSSGSPQGQSGFANAGTWDTVTVSPTPTTSSGFSYTVNMNQLGLPYVRVVFINSTGSGVITGNVFCKSLG